MQIPEILQVKFSVKVVIFDAQAYTLLSLSLYIYIYISVCMIMFIWSYFFKQLYNSKIVKDIHNIYICIYTERERDIEGDKCIPFMHTDIYANTYTNIYRVWHPSFFFSLWIYAIISVQFWERLHLPMQQVFPLDDTDVIQKKTKQPYLVSVLS